MQWTGPSARDSLVAFTLLGAAIAAPCAALAQSAAVTAVHLPALSTEVIAARSLPATVTIITLGIAGDTLGLGSGFLVRPSGVLVTNAHVMKGAAHAIVILASGERYERVEVLDHAFRRLWATERKALPVKDVAAAGGWEDVTTLINCYQQPDEDTLRSVVDFTRSAPSVRRRALRA